MAMMIRQNATHKVVIGPVVAVANGYVPVTTLTVSGADEAEAILHDNATVVDISGYTFAAITTADGYYHLTLQSGISGTVGHMSVVINDDSLCLPVRTDFIVVEETVYDALYTSTAPGYLQPTTAGRTLDVTAGGCAGVDWANVEAPTTTLGLTNTTVGVLTTYTGNTPQTGDSYARIGATGSGLTSLASQTSVDTIDNFIDTEIADIQARLPAALVGGRMDSSIGAAAANTITASALATDAVAEIADGVWDEALAGHAGVGSTGAALSAAGGSGDPWSTAVPGAYGAGTAGYIIGNNLDATVSSRASQTSVNTIDDLLDTEMPALTTAVADLPTNAELATALAAADDAVLAAIADVPTVTEFEARTPSAAQLANIVSTGADWINGGRLDLIIDAILEDTGTTLPGQIDDIGIKKNTAFSNFEFLMVLAADHVTPATGLTVTGQRSIDGAAFASVSGTIAEVSNGIYQFDAAAADTNGDVITWRFSSATADDAFITFKTVA